MPHQTMAPLHLISNISIVFQNEKTNLVFSPTGNCIENCDSYVVCVVSVLFASEAIPQLLKFQFENFLPSKVGSIISGEALVDLEIPPTRPNIYTLMFQGFQNSSLMSSGILLGPFQGVLLTESLGSVQQ